MCYQSEGLTWTVDNHKFTGDLNVIPLGGYDVILGVKWMTEVSPITFDYKHDSITINWQGQHLTLQQQSEHSHIQLLPNPTKIPTYHREEAYFLVQLTAIDGKSEEATTIPNYLHGLLSEYEDQFALPQQLPPPRTPDHHIPLKVGSQPVTANPYRCPIAHREEIEKITRGMLSAGIIRNSSSPFAAPVLLVRKKDNSWRLVVDYRALNAITVKNKFPIPVIEELLAELKGSKIYSKLDLRSGYHQIRVQQEDVYKTAFKTHQGHYEFLVMPFGLTNALVSFQSLMNGLFSEYLRKFVLIFFDDILIYSDNEDQHVIHLQKVFDILRENKLFIKRSKCELARSRIEYLGHIISAEGVAADDTKIQAMRDWPAPKTIKGLRGFLGLTGY